MGKPVEQTFRLSLVLTMVLCVLTSPIYEDKDLYAGSPCTLTDGKGQGTCVKLEDCSSKMQAVREGRYGGEDRCGFDNFTEIVCCGNSVDITDKLIKTESRAEAACQEYSNEVLVTEKSVEVWIYNGDDAKITDFPHMAALGYATRPDGEGGTATGAIEYTCGGTLISRQHVLTAAHCVSNIDERVPVQVRFGSTDLSVIDDSNSQTVSVSSVKPHPEYKRSRNYNDIAIIKLQEPVRLTNSVHPACLMTESTRNFEASGNQTLVVLGWGSTKFGDDLSPKLQKAVGLRFVEFDECSKSYLNKPSLPNGIEDTMICATDSNRTRLADACGGDSGGPLLVSSTSSRPVVAGVTSFGQACGGTTPSVYTSVYSYMDWIENEVWPSPEASPFTRPL